MCPGRVNGHRRTMTNFYTSDPHFGHKNIIRYCDRPFRDVDEMDEILIKRWNDVVTPDDTVWVLGDVALGDIEKSLSRIQRLNGTKHLVSGNHDRCWSGSKRHEEWLERYLDAGFATIQEETQVQIGGQTVILSHFPYQGDSHDRDRYTSHRPQDTGLWVVHGHVHTTWQVRGRQINVGVDVWEYTPVPESALAEIMANS